MHEGPNWIDEFLAGLERDLFGVPIAVWVLSVVFLVVCAVAALV